MKISYKDLDKWWCYEFDSFTRIGSEEQDLIKLRVAWKLWEDRDVDNEKRLRELYKAHKGALKIIKNVENKLVGKLTFKF